MTHSEQCKEYYRKNRDKILAQKRDYQARNRMKIRERMRSYHAARYVRLRPQIPLQTKQYAKSHPEIRAKIARNYKRNNPEKFAAYLKACHSKRKALMRGAQCDDATVSRLIASWRLEKSFVCHYCMERFPIELLQVDHVQPVSKEGRHSAGNVCKCCPSCNVRKSNKPVNTLAFKGQLILL